MGLTLQELAEKIGGRVKGDGGLFITRVAPIQTAGDGEITFLSNPKYAPYVSTTRASAIIVSPEMEKLDRNLLIAPNPYLAFARAVKVLMERPVSRKPAIHPSAVIGSGVQLGKDVSIGPFAVISDCAVLGDRVTVMAGAYVGEGATIGEDTIIHPNAVIYREVRIGRRCVIHSGAVIGSDGFGWVPDGQRYVAIPQVGTTVIGDDVSVGACSIINRGALGDTVVGNGTKIDSLVIISHNVEVGEHCLFVSQVGVSGSVKIGHHVTIGGQAGISGHLKIGDNVQIGAQAGVTHDLAPNKTYLGAPARPIQEMRRTIAAFTKLPELREDIRQVRKSMKRISALLERDMKAMRRDKENKPSSARSTE